MKKVLLHVGTPKTGTSYLQDVLFRNRESLRAQGILYPADRFDGHFPGRPRPDAPDTGRAGDRGGRRVGPAGRGGPRPARHLDHQPRDPLHPPRRRRSTGR
ncbi:hypothetical protein [Nocardioides sp. B-3]|uniref:hypothetical protein n=1 Tax=Nocardioides sp. B-3 TaxID=2895565 RepID=UPI00215325C2|nr:hypothetical protein [Nocardioides sp. B-3]UUZ61014.1 hypothetical protein LP418_10235 [Nocardioides sp. B-3]